MQYLRLKALHYKKGATGRFLLYMGYLQLRHIDPETAQ
jgi:hypothetical protein